MYPGYYVKSKTKISVKKKSLTALGPSTSCLARPQEVEFQDNIRSNKTWRLLRDINKIMKKENELIRLSGYVSAEFFLEAK